eukprot:g76898.t1
MAAVMRREAQSCSLKSVEAIREHLIRLVVDQGKEYAFVGELAGDTFLNKQEHLSCFLGGTLALGASLFPEGLNVSRWLLLNTRESLSRSEEVLLNKSKEHLRLAEQLANGCWLSYQSTTTGLGPERADQRL